MAIFGEFFKLVFNFQNHPSSCARTQGFFFFFCVFSLKWPSAISIYRQIWRYSENKSRKSLAPFHIVRPMLANFWQNNFQENREFTTK
jgi:hypothetical protein